MATLDERTIAIGQIWQQVSVAINERDPEDWNAWHWLQDLYYDPSADPSTSSGESSGQAQGQLFAITISGGRLFRWPVSVDGDTVTVGDPVAVQVQFTETSEPETVRKLRQALNGDPAADLALRPFDYLVIKEVPLWDSQEEVEIRGEVRFPGRYPIHRGETLRSVMERAGGLTDLAFPEGAIFTREELKERERKQLDTLATRMESDLAQFSLMSAQETGKDASDPVNVFARAQLMASDDPQAAIKVLEKTPLNKFPPGMQDDVALLKTQLYLAMGRTADARKNADTINLDNPDRKQARALAGSIVAQAWARTGKPKEALTLLDSLEIPKKDGEQIAIQMQVARIFARFAANQRKQAETELVALSDTDVNLLGHFLDPRFRVHPELQKLARRVLERNPAARRKIQVQRR